MIIGYLNFKNLCVVLADNWGGVLLVLRKTKVNLFAIMKSNESLSDVMFVIDSNNVINSYYTREQELLFMPSNQFMQQKFTDILPPLQAELFLVTANEARATKESRIVAYDMPLADGLHHFVSEYAPNLDINGNVLNLVVSIKDITEQQLNAQKANQTKELFNGVLESTPSGISFRDITGNIIECNRAFTAIMEGEANLLLGKHFKDFMYPDEFENESTLIQKLIRNEWKEYRIEKRIITQSGKMKWVDSSVCIIRDEEHNPIVFVDIMNDITRTVEANNELKQLNEAKDKLMSIIGHDLRSPLMAIKGLIELLDDEVPREQFPLSFRVLDMMNESVTNAQTLLENLLEWVRTQSSVLNIKPQLININELLQESVQLIRQNAISKKIVIENVTQEQISTSVDGNMMRTVFRNLLMNAVKFTATGGRITCNILRNEHNIIIEIADTGIGMSKKMLEDLFVLPTQKSSYGTANEKGSGLGFAICKDFVHKHNGRIEVESELGKGSTFKVILPA